MSDILQFDEAASQRIVRLYSTPDVVWQRQQTLALLQPQRGQRALDLGSGPGLMARDLAQAVGGDGAVEGVDISKDMLEIARRQCADLANVEFRYAEATALPFEDEHFDVALSTQVLEYVPDVDGALRELYRALKPGGRALILDTDWDSCVWHTSDRERMHRVIDAWNTHCPHPFLPRTLARRTAAAGFAIDAQTVIPILNPDYDPETYSYLAMDFIVDYVPGVNGVSAEEVRAWADELHELGAAGEYFFSINRFVVIGHKPA